MTGYPDSYYAATAHPAPARPALAGEVEAEVCVVGAGFTGLSAALELAERGHRVVVVEAAKVGWGASGRNGGQIVNGLNAGPRDDRAALRARRRPDFVADRGAGGRADHPRAGGALRHRLRPEGRQSLRGLHARSRCASSRRSRRCGGATGTTISSCSTARGCGGMWRPTPMSGGCSTGRGGHLHPLNLALGQAAALEGLGGVIHEGSPVVRVEGIGRRRRWCGPRGARCGREAVILAGNAYLGQRGAGDRRPGDAVLDPDHGDRAARGARAARCCRPTSASRTCATCSTTTGCAPTGGCSGAAARSTAAPIRRTSGRSSCRTSSGSSPSSRGVRIDYRLVGQLRDLVQPGAAARADRAGGLLRAGLQRARGGRQPPVRADPRRGGARRPVAI